MPSGSGRPLAAAFVRVRADVSQVGPDIERGTKAAVQAAARPVRTGLADAFKGGFRDGVRQALPEAERGGAEAGGRLRKSLARKLEGVAAETRGAGRKAGDGFTKGAGEQIERGGGALRGKVDGLAGKLTGVFAGVFAAQTAVTFFKDAVKGASDLSEAGNKLQVLFGPAAPKVQQWAAGAARSLGLSELAAGNAAATFGIMAKAAGLAGQDAATFSTDFARLAGDLASFNNTSPEQAIEAIGSALRGEAEPIRAYGVLLDDATLRQEALRLGLIKTVSTALTPSQRVLAAQAAIYKQTSAAQGDFAKTSGGLANQQRILAAQFTNVQAQLGEKLLPAAVATVTFLNDSAIPAAVALGNGFAAIPGPIKAVIGTAVGLAVVGVAVQAITVKAAAAKIAMVELGVATVGVSKAGAALAAGGAVVGVAALSAGLGEYSGKADAGTRSTEELAGALDEMQRTGKLGAAGLDLFESGFGVFRRGADDSQDALREFGEAARGVFSNDLADMIGRAQNFGAREGKFAEQTRQLDAALSKLASSGNGLSAKLTFEQLTKAARDAGVPTDKLKDLFPQYAAAAATAAEATKRTAAAARTATTAHNGTKTATLSLKQAQEQLTRTLGTAAGVFLDVRAADRSYRESLVASTAAAKANGRTLTSQTVKGRANEAALDDQARSALTYLSAINAQQGPGKRFQQVLAQTRNDLIRAGERFGLGRTAARKYADQILATPKAIATKVNTPGLAAARKGVKGLAADIKNVNGKSVRIQMRADGSFITLVNGKREGLVGRAAGGPIPGPPSSTDNTVIRAASGEHMWSAREVARAGGHAVMEQMRARARRGELQGLAAGGAVNLRTTVAGLPRRGAIDHYFTKQLTSYARAAQNAIGGTGPAGPANAMGYQRQMALLRGAFPGLQLISGFRPGSITATGNRSYHGMGRAVDIPPSMKVFNWIRQRYGGTARELIFSPAGSRQVHNGRPHVYKGITKAMHYDHVHWAMDRGGLAKGMGYMAKATIKPERVLDPRQTEAFERAMERGFAGSRADLDYLADRLISGLGGRRAVTLDGGVLAGAVDRELGRTYNLSVRGG